jgi:methionine sulfoxide reductase heme-binding subunit
MMRHLKLVLIVGCLIPLLWLGMDIVFNQLGGNPIEAVHIRLGDWALRFLWLTLAITPLQKITQWPGLLQYRQLFGLYAFFYGTLHVLVYLVVDHALIWSAIATDIVESRYIWFGVIAYLIVLALGLTSSKFAKKRLGKNWKKLHQLIYVGAVAAMIHYFWQLKGNLAEPLLYLILIILLLAFRLVVWVKKARLKVKQVSPYGMK